MASLDFGSFCDALLPRRVERVLLFCLRFLSYKNNRFCNLWTVCWIFFLFAFACCLIKFINMLSTSLCHIKQSLNILVSFVKQGQRIFVLFESNIAARHNFLDA